MRLRSLGTFSALTRRSKGRSALVYASRAARRTRLSSSSKVGSPDRSPRITSVLRKSPMSGSSSSLSRPAIGVPTQMSSWPAARRQDQVHGEQHHERRGAGAPGEPVDAVGQLGGEPEQGAAASEVLTGGRGRSVGRSSVGGSASLRRQWPSRSSVRSSGRLALPPREVRVLDRQRLPRRRHVTGEERPVQRGQLAREHADRPAVHGDVVEHDVDRVFPLGQAQQARPERRLARQVEPPLDLLPDEPRGPRLTVRLGKIRQVQQVQIRPVARRARLVDDLDGSAVPAREAGPQDLVLATISASARSRASGSSGPRSRWR